MHHLHRHTWVAGVAAAALVLQPMTTALGATGRAQGNREADTATPIKHIIVLLGENRTFDHVFGTYVPDRGQSVRNLLSEGIMNADGTPGPNFDRARQWQAVDATTYSIHPTKTSPYVTLPAINIDGTPSAAPFPSVAAAESAEPALPDSAYDLLTMGGSGFGPGKFPDPRFPILPNGPVDVLNYLSNDNYAGSPVHRFYQMWQQTDCEIAAATVRNPSGCQNDLFPWVETTIGAGNNGQPRPAVFTDQTTGEGGTAMEVYSTQQGASPYFERLAHQYAISDNFHQSVEGGTGANHIELFYGSPMFYANADGTPGVPPVNQIENPNPQPDTNNYYTDDGYGGGSYSNCSDAAQPGVGSILTYLASLPYHPRSGCYPGEYYLLNNYNPGYFGDGTPAPLGAAQFTIPPTRQPHLGMLLDKHSVSWAYYGEGWADGTEKGENGTFCNICNGFLYSTQTMTNAAERTMHLKGIRDLYADIDNSTLPAVSFVKPDGYLDGHPASSKWELFEAFSQKIIEKVQSNPELWKDTAVIVTVDEGGGYWDSGYIQPLDFFGDGTRIPLIVVSKYSQGLGVVHSYTDHVSIDKFIERNWNLGETISSRGRDNLPNPVSAALDPYLPLNSPAIGDLFDMFKK